MMEVGVFILAALCVITINILQEVKKIERKIEDARDKPKHEKFWGKGGKR